MRDKQTGNMQMRGGTQDSAWCWQRPQRMWGGGVAEAANRLDPRLKGRKLGPLGLELDISGRVWLQMVIWALTIPRSEVRAGHSLTLVWPSKGFAVKDPVSWRTL